MVEKKKISPDCKIIDELTLRKVKKVIDSLIELMKFESFTAM